MIPINFDEEVTRKKKKQVYIYKIRLICRGLFSSLSLSVLPIAHNFRKTIIRSVQFVCCSRVRMRPFDYPEHPSRSLLGQISNSMNDVLSSIDMHKCTLEHASPNFSLSLCIYINRTVI